METQKNLAKMALKRALKRKRENRMSKTNRNRNSMTRKSAGEI